VVDGPDPFTQLSGTCTNEITAALPSSVSQSSLCSYLSTLESNLSNSKVGLYLHFGEAGSPTIRDRSNNALSGVSEGWTEKVDGSLRDEDRVAGDFTDPPILVTVDCPKDASAD
jgi:hypothetical protein